jgi:N-acetylneuraminic acid mutarotase
MRTLPVVTLLLVLLLSGVSAQKQAPFQQDKLPVVDPEEQIPLLEKRYAHSSALRWPHLYLMGGTEEKDGGYTHVERVDLGLKLPVSEIWRPEDSLSQRIYGTAATAGSKIYLFGGYQKLSLKLPEGGKIKTTFLTVYLPLVESIDLKTGVIKTLEARIPRPRWVAEAHFSNGEIHILGGGQNGLCRCCGKLRCSAVDVFNPSTGEFRVDPKMPTSREANTAITPDGRIFVFGGFDGRESRKEVQVYLPKEAKWNPLKPMPVVTSTGGACYWKGHLIAIGDFVNPSLITVYDIAKDKWHYGRGTSKIRNQSTAHVHGDRIYVVGGKFRDMSVSDTIQVYDAGKLVAKIKGL